MTSEELLIRRPRGFRAWSTGPRGGVLWTDIRGDTWIIMAAPPNVQLDNMHRDRRPHLHAWSPDGDERHDLRPDLTLEEARRRIQHALATQGWIDVDALRRDLA
ncbi:MAG TPA: hypothetical protein VI997_12590 [Candidatus Thermoplasmatota archaeon]|nr:hypothetical protein [Candidatus Thermoplasmatota archaeon]